MEKTIIDDMYKSVDIIEEIKDIDQQLERLNNSAVKYAEDINGTNTINTLAFQIKDMQSVNVDLEKLHKTINEQPKMPLPGIFGAVVSGVANTRPEAEYAIHSKNTDKMILHLDPSESLLIISQMASILGARRIVLINLLEATFPTKL